MNLIKQKLSSIGKSQSWLASQTKLANTYINNLAGGKIPNPTIRTALRIAKALGCRIEDLWSVNGQPKAKNEEDWI